MTPNMKSRRRANWPGLGVVALLLTAGVPVLAQDGRTCEPSAPRAGVSLIVLTSAARVTEFAATVRNVQILRRGPKTVVFADGRVVTSDVAAVSAHLNALGWANRNIEIVASHRSRSVWRPG